MRDSFDRPGVFRPAEVGGRPPVLAAYLVNMGALDGSSVRNGRLTIDSSCSINPFENFACDFSLPVDEQGRRSFTGSEYFGDLELEVTLLKPRIAGPEKFKIGLVDDQLFFGAATISLEKDGVHLERQGGEPRTLTPFLETTFDQADLTRIGEMDEVGLKMTVDSTGRAAALVKARSGTSVEVFRLATHVPWARLSPHGRYSAHIFVEDLAKPRIFSVYPETVRAEKLRAAGGVLQMKIFGIGLGKDSAVELAPEGGGESVWARDASILMFNMGARVQVKLAHSSPQAYTVRIHTSGLSASVERGFRVLP
jgi:hypothetical protein